VALLFAFGLRVFAVRDLDAAAFGARSCVRKTDRRVMPERDAFIAIAAVRTIADGPSRASGRQHTQAQTSRARVPQLHCLSQ
jgi:hypothetical protein